MSYKNIKLYTLTKKDIPVFRAEDNGQKWQVIFSHRWKKTIHCGNKLEVLELLGFFSHFHQKWKSHSRVVRHPQQR